MGFFGRGVYLELGTFFDRLRMSGGKSQNELEKELDENSEGRLRMTEAKGSFRMT